MALDALCISALCAELEKEIVGMKVDKVQQPEKDQLVLSLRGSSGARKLLISAGVGSARLHLTEEGYENPSQPPMFCMLMRKHLTNGRITGLTQPEGERLVDITLEAPDAMGVLCQKRLVVELMGRYSNIILVDSDGLIVDCLHRIDSEMSEKRPVLPGLVYRLPPKQDKPFFLTADEASLRCLLSGAAEGKTLEKTVMGAYSGLSPLLCRELAYRAYGSTDACIGEARERDNGEGLVREALKLAQTVREGRFTPVLLSDGSGKPTEFSFTEIGQYESALSTEPCATFSQLLEAFFSRRDRAESMRQRSQALTKTIKNHRDRTARKLALQKEELRATFDREALREQGDLITANLYAMKKGMTVLCAEDFYSETGGKREIRLDPLKTPQQNAAKYYKDYAKAKNAERYLTGQIETGETELEYLNSVLEELSKAESERDLAEIRQELTDSGYIRQKTGGKKEKRVEQAPLHFRSDSGYDIWVGRNNGENDKLTLKTAFKRDLWLHAQKIHGSHVILSCDGAEPDRESLILAAQLAAYYSQARDGGNVPVDYTAVKYVKKPSGAKPGMVIYTDYKTVMVHPDEAIAEKHRVKK